MIELKNDHLIFRFPEVHRDAECRISFQRTLRIPDDNRAHSLPPGLGDFPLNLVDDYASNVPDAWNAHGGVFLPMYQAEALWLDFDGSYPMAVKVAAGKINAVTGEGWENELSGEAPRLCRHSRSAVVGRIQCDGGDDPAVCGHAPGRRLHGRGAVDGGGGARGTSDCRLSDEGFGYTSRLCGKKLFIAYSPPPAQAPPREMGLAPGGLMRQEIYEDEYGLEAWETSVRSRCFVHILNSVQFFDVTGARPPSKPPTAREYTAAGLPWFDYYGGDLKALEGAQELAGLDSVAVKKLKKGEGVLADNEPVEPKVVKTLGKGKVREGEF